MNRVHLIDMDGQGRFEAWAFPEDGARSRACRLAIPAMPLRQARKLWRGDCFLHRVGEAEFRVVPYAG